MSQCWILPFIYIQITDCAFKNRLKSSQESLSNSKTRQHTKETGNSVQSTSRIKIHLGAQVMPGQYDSPSIAEIQVQSLIWIPCLCIPQNT